MGKATLVSQELEDESKLISDGARLIESLNKLGFQVVAAFWGSSQLLVIQTWRVRVETF